LRVANVWSSLNGTNIQHGWTIRRLIAIATIARHVTLRIGSRFAKNMKQHARLDRLQQDRIAFTKIINRGDKHMYMYRKKKYLFMKKI